MARRRTFAAALRASALSELPALRQGTESPSAAWSPALVSYAGSRGSVVRSLPFQVNVPVWIAKNGLGQGAST